MIWLEGLTLLTGRHVEARAILRTFAAHTRDGLIPNMFPDQGGEQREANLNAGVTTVRDLGGMGGASVDVAVAVAVGLIPGLHLQRVARSPSPAAMASNIALSRQVDGADAVRAAVREEIRDGATAIKLIATGGVLTPGIPPTFSAFTAEELEAGVREAHERDLPVAAHAIGANGIRAAVLAGVDSIEHCNPSPSSTASSCGRRRYHSVESTVVTWATRIGAVAVALLTSWPGRHSRRRPRL